MRGHPGVSSLFSRFSPVSSHLLMTNERLGYGMVVWITVRRHPPVVTIRAAETAMPIGGIRFLTPSWKRAGHVRYVWASIGENARGRLWS